MNIDKHKVHLVYLTWDKVTRGEPLSEDHYFDLIAEGLVPEQLILLFREGYTPGQILNLSVNEEPDEETEAEELLSLEQLFEEEYNEENGGENDRLEETK